mgnify:CR=1 FL=1
MSDAAWKRRLTGLLALLGAGGLAPGLQACTACFGRSDSKLAEGLNMGIFALLGVILLVLVWISAFFIYLARRSSSAAEDQEAALPPT